MWAPVGRRARALGAVSVLAALLALAAGCSTGSNAVARENGGQNRYVAGSGSRSYAPDERAAAPTITGTLLNGKHFDLSSWRGHVVVVNFWASWCNPCAAEAPDMEKVYRTTKPDGVRFLGLNIRDQHDAAIAFVRGRHLSYPSLYDPAGRAALGFQHVSPETIPATLVLDTRGRVAFLKRGAILAGPLTTQVRHVLREH